MVWGTKEFKWSVELHSFIHSVTPLSDCFTSCLAFLSLILHVSNEDKYSCSSGIYFHMRTFIFRMEFTKLILMNSCLTLIPRAGV